MRDEADAEARRRLELALGLGAARDLQQPAPPRPAQRSGRASSAADGAAVAVDQGSEGARPDVLGADQAQPVEALLVGEAVRAHAPFADALADAALGAGREPPDILAMCFHHRRAVRITNSSAIWRSPSHHSTSGVAALATSAESEE